MNLIRNDILMKHQMIILTLTSQKVPPLTVRLQLIILFQMVSWYEYYYMKIADQNYEYRTFFI